MIISTEHLILTLIIILILTLIIVVIIHFMLSDNNINSTFDLTLIIISVEHLI